MRNMLGHPSTVSEISLNKVSSNPHFWLRDFCGFSCIYGLFQFTPQHFNWDLAFSVSKMSDSMCHVSGFSPAPVLIYIQMVPKSFLCTSNEC